MLFYLVCENDCVGTTRETFHDRQTNLLCVVNIAGVNFELVNANFKIMSGKHRFTKATNHFP